MGRRKIRHSGPHAYALNPDEILPISAMVRIKPRLGRGSGRAGGARSSTHRRDHAHRVHAGTKPENCPICRFGASVWDLWLDSKGGTSEAWLEYWECRMGELDTFLMFLADYEVYAERHG
jgi:hypothetical protein